MERQARRPDATGFTIIELIVVITVIVLILAIAVPGLSSMSAESHFNAATHSINGAVTLGYYTALGDMNMVSLRFMPGEWDAAQTADAQRPTRGPHLVTYTYTGTSAADPNNPTYVRFGEYFQRREKTASVVLPEDVGVAPVEALDRETRYIPTDTNGDGTLDAQKHQYNNVGKDFVLTGTPGTFALNGAAASTSSGFFQADDFLITFDPQSGLRGGVPTPMRLKAYDPVRKVETDRDNSGSIFYQRYNFSGIVLYQREPFAALGSDPQKRQDWLRSNGRPFLVHRFGGGLVMGSETGH